MTTAQHRRRMKLREERTKWPLKDKARNKLLAEVYAGRIIRPTICQECDATPGYDAAGRCLIQGDHHMGYEPENALNVRWLCNKCHCKVEKTRRDESEA